MRRSVAVVLVAMALAVGTGCSATGTGSDRSGAPPSTTNPTGPVTLADLVTTTDELLEGEEVTSPPDARQLGVGSVGYCGFPFPSEDLRTERHQATIKDADGEWQGVTEAVRYEPGGAHQAVDEMRTALIECPEDELIDPTHSGEPGAERHEYAAFPLDEADLREVASDHVAARVTFTTEDGASTTTYSVFQRRGDVLLIALAPNEERVLDLANAAGKRLAAAPAASVGD